MLLSMQQETMLQHPNMKTKHMAMIYRRWFTKEEHWSTAKSHHNRFKQAWKKCKRYQVTDLVKITTCQESNIRKPCLEQENNILQEHIIAKQGINLANQVCLWKDEMISVEIDIKIAGNGCTVCKWQAKQEWHNSAINSMRPSRMQQETKLLHSNIATKHMEVIYSRCFTKDEHWATAQSHKSRFKQAWQKCKR